jgi:dTDP-4-amino-4,6-dideoxygalactose transaminase
MPAILFNRPSFAGGEIENIQLALAQGHLSGDGAFTRKCHALLEAELGVEKALLTTSCTHALEMAALLLDLQPGDEVIAPTFTFVSSVNAFVLRGANPRFVDIRPDTLNIDASKVEAAIGPRTRALVLVHYAGVGCDMDALVELAARRRIAVVEDHAHGPFARYKGRPLGTFGAFATLSFHETKNFSCGEGGALLINDAAHVERAEIIREKGTNRSRFFRGQIDKYGWVDVGSSYLPSEILAAVLFAQLGARERIQARRQALWARYQQALGSWASASGVALPHVPAECQQSHHLFYLLLPSLELRQRFLAHMKSRDIMAVFHYLPLHLSEMGRRFGGRTGDCPVAESASDRLVRLPLFYDLSDEDQQRVIDAVLAFRG